MNVADFVKVGAGVAQKIGALSATQVQGLMAQSASTANQPANAFSITQGIGKFGINPTQLESSGFLKPGTLAQFGKNATVTAADLAEAQKLSAEGTAITAQQVASNRQIKDLLQTSSVWTGKNGLTSLNSLLGDVNSQASVQVGLLSKGFNDLSKAGVIPTSLPTAQLGSLVQSAGKFGSAATALWSKGAAPADLVNQLDNLAKQGQFAVNFTDQKLPEGAAGEIVATGAKNTVNRKVLNQSVAAFIGTAKVPKINYGQPVEPPVPAPIADAPQTPTTITDSIFDSFTNKYWASTATFYPVSGTINIIINSGSGAVVYSGLAPEVQARIQQDRKADIVQDAANQKFYDDLLAVIAAQINRLKATANTQVNTV
jgi:hypothetical protein